jgi:very-short-patch-repair endonuclease
MPAMGGSRHHSASVWGLARAQHGVVTWGQLREFGLGRHGIRHRVGRGRLHPVARGVYAVGRGDLDREGRWMAAVLCCGDGAVLSHGSAAALMGFGSERDGLIEVSVRSPTIRRHSGLRVHRRPSLRDEDVGSFDRIPVTSPAQTLIDLAAEADRITVERMVDEADRLDLISPPELRAELERHPGQRGVARLRTWLDRRTFRLTRSRLERRFLPLAREAGLPVPETKVRVNGFEVDFLWSDLRLVVETDGLRHHRTPAQQSRDHRRDHAHAAAGFTSLRFTHEQVRYEPEHVRAVLGEVARRLGVAGRASAPHKLR